MGNMRASRLPLLTKCVGSAVLPNLPDGEKSDNARRSAAWGTMVHRWKETGAMVGEGRAPKMLFEAVAKSGVDRAELWPSEGRHEVAVAVRVDGKREVASNESHKYETIPGWITGTADFAWRLTGGELWVDDLKTGRVYPNPGPEDSRRHDPSLEVGANRYPQDPGSAQLRFYALAIARLVGYVGVVHVSITHWPYLPVARRHVAPDRLWARYAWEDLEKFWGELELLHASQEFLEAAAFTERWDEVLALLASPGDHCRFCPSKLFCQYAQEQA